MGGKNRVWPVSRFFFRFSMEGSAIIVLNRPFYSQEDMFRYFSVKGLFLPLPRPFPDDDHERKEFENLDPFQVFSCWNGAAVIDPSAFFAASSANAGATQPGTENIGDKGDEHSHMHLESLDPKSDKMTRSSSDSSSGIRFRTARNDVSSTTEKASECFLICVDLWRRGMGRIMMAPKARWVLQIGRAHV